MNNLKDYWKQRVKKIRKLTSDKKIVSFIKQNEKLEFFLLMCIVLIDSLFLQMSSDIVLFGIIGLYFLYAKYFHKNSKLTYTICLGILLVMAVSFIFSQASNRTEKLAVWLFLFLLVGIIQAWRE